MPAFKSFSITRTDLDAGPSVQTILVFGLFSITPAAADASAPLLIIIFFIRRTMKRRGTELYIGNEILDKILMVFLAIIIVYK